CRKLCGNFYHSRHRRHTQVVRESSAKALFSGSNPLVASNFPRLLSFLTPAPTLALRRGGAGRARFQAACIRSECLRQIKHPLAGGVVTRIPRIIDADVEQGEKAVAQADAHRPAPPRF